MSDTKTVTHPAATSRKKILKEMTPELRAVARELHDKETKAAQGSVIIRYHQGEMISQLHKEEATYGSKAVEQLAAYMGATTGYMHALMDFADSFTREFVLEWTGKPMD